MRSGRPSRSRNTRSIGKRIPNVWTERQRGSSSATPSGGRLSQERPRSRDIGVTATQTQMPGAGTKRGSDASLRGSTPVQALGRGNSPLGGRLEPGHRLFRRVDHDHALVRAGHREDPLHLDRRPHDHELAVLAPGA